MGRYSINDFTIGDEVYHLSNEKIIMVAIDINHSSNDIFCRWLDKEGKIQTANFLSFELGKEEDLFNGGDIIF